METIRMNYFIPEFSKRFSIFFKTSNRFKSNAGETYNNQKSKFALFKIAQENL